tara:strand:- start:1262 stop:2398 length:1137 start_codon:yes stop_codon:yes gene_type:complete
MNGSQNNHPHKVITVQLKDREYQIIVGDGIISEAITRISNLFERIECCNIISDEIVANLYLDSLLNNLNSMGIKSNEIIIPSGENAKNFQTLERVVESLIDSKVDREMPIIALGGGVVGDLAGFTASILLRGVPLIQIPTTLLAQVDSSVGGKTGINSVHGKNLIGSFYQPRLVLADTNVIKTLPKRELLAGYAEIVKYALINNSNFFSWLEKNHRLVLTCNTTAIEYTISLCCKIKAEIVAADEREANRRAVLNLGHTFGHALETEAGYNGSLLHGEAVAAGIVIATQLSMELGFCSKEDYLRIKQHFQKVGLPTNANDLPFENFDLEKLLSHIRKDKKAKSGWPKFILIRGIGNATIESIKEEMVKKVLQDFIQAN